jgi:hypothetical protein
MARKSVLLYSSAYVDAGHSVAAAQYYSKVGVDHFVGQYVNKFLILRKSIIFWHILINITMTTGFEVPTVVSMKSTVF